MVTTTRAAPDRLDPRPALGWSVVPLGLLAGLALGAVARGWMRLISGEPEFTWSGTIFIVGAFAVFGAGQATSWQARRAWHRRWAVSFARTAGVITTLPLFVGAGAIMLPTVLGCALARWRRGWHRGVRIVAAVLAVPPVVVVVVTTVDEVGWTPRALAGIAAFAATYAVVVAALRPTVERCGPPRRLGRSARVAAGIAGIAVLGLLGGALRGL